MTDGTLHDDRQAAPQGGPAGQNAPARQPGMVALRVQLGHRQLTADMVGQLEVASVVELDCPAEAGVELYADGKLIARGQAVTVDGKLAVWVKELGGAGN